MILEKWKSFEPWQSNNAKKKSTQFFYYLNNTCIIKIYTYTRIIILYFRMYRPISTQIKLYLYLEKLKSTLFSLLFNFIIIEGKILEIKLWNYESSYEISRSRPANQPKRKNVEMEVEITLQNWHCNCQDQWKARNIPELTNICWSCLQLVVKF